LDIHLLAMLNYQHSYMEKMTREPVIKDGLSHSNTFISNPGIGEWEPHLIVKKVGKYQLLTNIVLYS